MTTATVSEAKTNKKSKPQADETPSTAIATVSAGRRRHPDAVAAFAKITTAQAEFLKSLVERKDELEMVLVGLVAGENCLLIGAPGTAKSMLCDDVAELIGGKRFSVLLNRFTAPEEVFGPPSLKSLEEGRYERIIADYLADADTAFFDEIFKASPAILNTLLKILNEKTYKNGTAVVNCPLKFALAASNETPNGDNAAELSALFDRFVLRKSVRAVATIAGREQLLFGSLARNKVHPLTEGELAAARAESANVPWSDEAKAAMFAIIDQLMKAGIRPGDRRLRKSVGIARAAAWLDGADEVLPEHLSILQHVLWDDMAEQPKKAAEIIMKACNPDGAAVAELVMAAHDIVEKTNLGSTDHLVKSSKELADIIKKLERIKSPSAQLSVNKIKDERKRFLEVSMKSS